MLAPSLAEKNYMLPKIHKINGHKISSMRILCLWECKFISTKQEQNEEARTMCAAGYGDQTCFIGLFDGNIDRNWSDYSVYNYTQKNISDITTGQCTGIMAKNGI